MSQPRHVVFVHLPKTGGTSVRTAFERARPEPYRVLFDYGPRSTKTTPDLTIALQNRNHQSLILSGHFRASRYAKDFPRGTLVTFLRHPVDRAFSAYAAQQRLGFQGSLTDFLKGRHAVCFRRFLDVALDQFGFIGFTEDFERSMQRLSQHVGFQ